LFTSVFWSIRVSIVKAEETIYIQANGSIDPPDSPLVTLDTVTYTLTGNVNSNGSGIVVRRDHIVLDGMGYALVSGTASVTDFGIDASDRTNVTIRNIHIENYTKGILVLRSSNNNITANTLRGNGIGISLQSYSDYNSITGMLCRITL
jgi:parallel beta-helix repeat protein